MATVVLLKGAGQYGALRLHIDQAAAAFRALGYDTTVLDFSGDAWRQDMARIAGPVALIFSLSILAESRFDGKTLAELLGAPHVVMYVDHPGWFVQRSEQTPSDTRLLMIDHTHCDFVRSWFGPDRFPYLETLPPGANRLEEPQDRDAEDWIARRDIPVLFTGTFRGVPKPQWREMASSPALDLFKLIFEAAADIAGADDTMPAESALDMACTAYGLTADHPMAREALRYSFWLSEYMHSVRRFEALKQLGKAGVNVHIYGAGFEGQMYRFKSFTYGGVGSFLETLSLLQRARVVLNTNTHFVSGGHERVFAAMAAGAAVVSDISTWYQDAFVDGRDIALYRWTKPAEVAEKTIALLDDPARAYHMACAGRQVVEGAHLWVHRATRILAVAGTDCRAHVA
jgi:hypothetical protein